MTPAELHAAAAALTARTRAEQGLPPHLEDVTTFARIARILVGRDEAPVRGPRRLGSTRTTGEVEDQPEVEPRGHRTGSVPAVGGRVDR